MEAVQATPTSRRPRVVRTRMSVAEVARYLERHENTIRLWARARAIPTIRIGRRIEFDRVAIDRWLASKTTQAT
jgi:excisionase family DNA binding protein